MGVWKEQLTPIERRMKARFIRYLAERTETRTMEEAAIVHHVSRAYAYQILKELDKWESTHTFEQEADEINNYRFGDSKAITWEGMGPEKWLLMSGRAIHAYASREIESTMLGAPHADRAPSIGVMEAIGLEPKTDDDELLS
jgi:hypothetical protein